MFSPQTIVAKEKNKKDTPLELVSVITALGECGWESVQMLSEYKTGVESARFWFKLALPPQSHY